MIWKRIQVPLLVAFVIFSMVFGWYILRLSKELSSTNVVFLNVGQGDAILISQGNNQILIDGGRGGKTLLSHLGRYIPFWDRTIETVIVTHPDADHIGGFLDLFRAYRIETIVSTNAHSDTNIFRALQTAIQAEGSRIFVADRGMSLVFPRGGRLEILFPPAQREFSSSNEGSVVSRFSFGETDFLLTGDLPREESFLPDIPESEVLKLAHHGSKYSSSDTFLSAVRPKEAILSVGENSYGHPAREALDRLAGKGIILRRTDISGDIRYRCFAESSRCEIY